MYTGRSLSLFAKGELEAVGEKGAQHQIDLIGGGLGFGLGGDVVMFGVDPGGSTGKLMVLDLVGHGDELLEGHVGGDESSTGLELEADAVFAGMVGLDGGDFEGRRILRERAQRGDGGA